MLQLLPNDAPRHSSELISESHEATFPLSANLVLNVLLDDGHRPPHQSRLGILLPDLLQVLHLRWFDHLQVLQLLVFIEDGTLGVLALLHRL